MSGRKNSWGSVIRLVLKRVIYKWPHQLKHPHPKVQEEDRSLRRCVEQGYFVLKDPRRFCGGHFLYPRLEFPGNIFPESAVKNKTSVKHHEILEWKLDDSKWYKLIREKMFDFHFIVSVSSASSLNYSYRFSAYLFFGIWLITTLYECARFCLRFYLDVVMHNPPVLSIPP